ncbi:MAG: ATP-binding cassette domain-containing protein [Coriobacteriaceae bacterium]|nr:ATP-binding cassette domain-containing protein [Coriobacteriaceae bacterium]
MSLELDIKKHYADFDLDVQLEVGQERVALLGASGCGKSLTLRCIAGVETPDEGRIVVDGVTFFDSVRGINLSAQERRCALLFQNYQLFPHMTVEENVCAGMRGALRRWGHGGPVASAREEARVFLRIFGVEALAARYPAQLSGGQQQRVALARMLAARPGILMFDEPLSALDAYLKSALEQNLIDVFSLVNRTVLYVSHDIDEACRLCDRICVLHNGRIEEQGSPEDLLVRPQTLAALRLTGCKNTSRARKAGPRQVEAIDWGMTFETGCDVPDNVAFVGIRASYIHREHAGHAGERARNSFDLRVARVSDARFERLVLLDPPRSDAPTRIQWKVGKVDADPASLPHEGDVLRLHFDARRLMMVTR